MIKNNEDSDKKSKVLIIAESANPEWVSVPLIGWSIIKALSEIVDLHFVTQIRNRDALLRSGLKEGQDFTCINSEPLAAPLYKLSLFFRGDTSKGWSTAAAFEPFAYWYFEYLTWRLFANRIKSHQFDLVHRVTPLSPATPSFIVKKLKKHGVPFILGPLNGGLKWPKEFRYMQHSDREWLAYFREFYKLFPGYKSTRKHASAIIVGSIDTWKQMPEKYHHKCVYIPENAIDPTKFKKSIKTYQRAPLKVAFVSRLVADKGADMLIEALAEFIQRKAIELHILGDGPEKERLQRLSNTLQLNSGVVFHGWVKHDKLQHYLTQCHIFGFPAVREFGGAVVLECMALGLVPVVVNYGGPAELISPKTGFSVPLGSRQEIINHLHATFQRILENSYMIDQMSKNARKRVMKYFTWSAKASQIKEIYHWVLGLRSEKPDFGMPFPD